MTRLSTFSIVAADATSGECGVAVASKFLAAGAVVPWARGGVGAIATQSYANTSHGPEGLAMLADGIAPETVMERLIARDPDAHKRQVGIVDLQGRSATFSRAPIRANLMSRRSVSIEDRTRCYRGGFAATLPVK